MKSKIGSGILSQFVRAALLVCGGLGIALESGCQETTAATDAGVMAPEGNLDHGASGVDGSGASRDLLPPADLSRPSRAVLINFDDYSGEITNQYQRDAIFSTTSGKANVTLSFADYFQSSKPNILCGTSSCAEPTYVDFKNPVSNLTFLSVGVNNTGKVADVNVYVRGAKAATVPLTGMGMATTPVIVDLSMYADITRIEIASITDFQGIGYDDFRFMTY